MKIYRGAQVAPGVLPEAVDSLFAAGANLLRYQITTDRNTANGFTRDQFIAFVMGHVQYIKTTVIPRVSEGKKIVVYLHVPAGGYDLVETNKFAMFTGHAPWGRAAMFDVWYLIAQELKNIPQVIAYGLCNEPAGNAEQVRGLMKQCVRRVRTVDPTRLCIIVPPYSDPAKFSQIQVLQDKHIWYSAHMYYPADLTHQGIAERPYPKPYPFGNLNKTKLESFLGSMTRFARDKKLTCYIGEFSISNFATDETRINYLRDCISIFEERNWHWSYHAWREASVWDVEPRPNVFQVLKDAWGENG